MFGHRKEALLGAADGDAIGDRYGLSISNSGLILAIASNTSNSNTGYVKVYQWDTESSEWEQLGNIFTGDAGSRFGSSVSLNKDGTTLAIGAFSNDDNGIDTGQTKVYFWDGASGLKEEVILMELPITITVVMMLELMLMEPD